MYTFPMLTGFQGQVEPQDYPEEWYDVKQQVDTGQQDYNLLFLPWHQYMRFDWLQQERKTVANPARVFFDKPVFKGENVEVGGIYSQSSRPSSRYIRFLLGLGPDREQKNVTNLGELLTPLNVKYVLVTKQVDWKGYRDFLEEQQDLELVMNNSEFLVYRNRYEVSRSYAVNRVRYVSGWQHFLDLSEEENVTRSAYVIDPEKAGEERSVGEVDQEEAPAEQLNPAKYRLGNASNRWTVFTQRQDSSFDDWTLDGGEEKFLNLGLAPVFDSGGGVLRYSRFYRVYLPSYVVSLSALVLLAAYYLGVRD